MCRSVQPTVGDIRILPNTILRNGQSQLIVSIVPVHCGLVLLNYPHFHLNHLRHLVRCWLDPVWFLPGLTVFTVGRMIRTGTGQTQPAGQWQSAWDGGDRGTRSPTSWGARSSDSLGGVSIVSREECRQWGQEQTHYSHSRESYARNLLLIIFIAKTSLEWNDLGWNVFIIDRTNILSAWSRYIQLSKSLHFTVNALDRKTKKSY